MASDAGLVRVGIIGAGLMGREIATAIARWGSLTDHPVRPVLTAVCDVNSAALEWFEQIDSIVVRTADYTELLESDDVDAVYVAVRHDLHLEIYTAVVRAGKDLLAEKPFGMDLNEAKQIQDEIVRAGVFARCSSEMPFYPAAQEAFRIARSGALGTVIEASNQLRHSSDMDLQKPINWKRQNATCGEAGVMNDLGMHVCHVPLRLGWRPAGVYASLQNIVPTRPDGRGGVADCDTWDNAILLCGVEQPGASAFPLTLGMKRLDPGQQNTWEFRVTGLNGGVEFSTRNPKQLLLMDRSQSPNWQIIETGSQSVFPTITGAIFEFGFSDAILQMLAAFFAERIGELGDRFGCVRPEEAVDSHRIFEAALASNISGSHETLPA